MRVFKPTIQLTSSEIEDFNKELMRTNYIRSRNLSILLLPILVAIIVFFDMPNLQKGFENVGASYKVLFYLHLFFSFTMLIFVGLSWGKLRSPFIRVTWGDKAFDWVFSLNIALICALFSVNDQRIDGGITIYVLGLFVVAMINYLNPLKSLIIYLSSYSVFLIGITKLQTNEIVLRGLYVNSAIILIIAWFMSTILYHTKVKEFISRRTIEKQKSQLEQANIELSETNNALHDSLLALDESQNMIFSLTLALESKDEYTRGHSERVAEYALALADYLGLDNKVKKNLWHAAILHDTGKIGIPDIILNKSTRLTEEEWKVMKSHPERGERICSKLRFTQEILPVIRHHHERYDGTGYPDGLQGDNIPYLARIVSIADMVDAVTSQRPYRTAQTIEKALNELVINAGIQFDPKLVDAFVQMYMKNFGLDGSKIS